MKLLATFRMIYRVRYTSNSVFYEKPCASCHLLYVYVISLGLTRGKNFNDALMRGLSTDLPDVVLVKRAPPPKNPQAKVRRRGDLFLRSRK